MFEKWTLLHSRSKSCIERRKWIKVHFLNDLKVDQTSFWTRGQWTARRYVIPCKWIKVHFVCISKTWKGLLHILYWIKTGTTWYPLYGTRWYRNPSAFLFLDIFSKILKNLFRKKSKLQCSGKRNWNCCKNSHQRHFQNNRSKQKSFWVYKERHLVIFLNCPKLSLLCHVTHVVVKLFNAPLSHHYPNKMKKYKITVFYKENCCSNKYMSHRGGGP